MRTGLHPGQPICATVLTYRQPNWWQPVIDEGKRVRNEVGLMDFSAMANFEVSGPNAESWLNFVLANRMPRLGRMTLSPMLSARGRLIGDFSVSHIEDNRFFLLGADYMQRSFVRHFDQFLPREGVTVTNLSASYSGLHICGPYAQDLISRLAARDMDTLSFPFMQVSRMSIGGIADVLTLRVSFTGETATKCICPLNSSVSCLMCC